MMQNSKIIGITGGISTGKSTVSGILKSRGYRIIDADEVSRDLMQKDKINYARVVRKFGKEILLPNREIDRKKLRNIVFDDPDKLAILNKITHESIYEEIKYLIRLHALFDKIIFVDIPLLVEGKIKRGESEGSIPFDEIWLVFVEQKIQVERLMKRDGISFEDAKKIIDAQMDLEQKKEFATRIFYNDKDREYLQEQIKQAIVEISGI